MGKLNLKGGRNIPMSMTLQEIIDQIDINVPNSLPLSTKIGFVNRIIEEYYRDHPVPDAVYPFITVPGQDFYELPPNCPEDRITKIVVDEKTYAYRDLRAPQTYFSWSIVAEHVQLYPRPERALDAFIFFRPRPEGMTESDLNTIPGFAYDFQEMLVYGGSQRVAVAMAKPDYERAAYYERQFEKVRDLADRRLRKPSQKRVAIYRPWR